MKFKVLKEFDRFYLAESPSGWKETFHKFDYKPDKDGYITKRREKNYEGNIVGRPPKNTPWKDYENVKTDELFFEEFLDVGTIK